MANKFTRVLTHAWNVFLNKDPTQSYYPSSGGSSYRPDIRATYATTEKGMVTALYNRIAMDVASHRLHHVRLDSNERYTETIKSSMNEVLSISANVDQTGKALIQDLVMSMFDEGYVALIPVKADIDPDISGGYQVLEARVGQILEWYPQDIRVKVYNDESGKREELIYPKKHAVIIENPLYSVMNQPNSTLQRLIMKLNLLDAIDKQSGSGKLDIIIQLPYVIKTERQKTLAEDRRKAIEEQLAGSQYGIAYTDGTEKVTQLNRPAENNLMKQIEFLTRMLYSQLGITEAVFDGTADEATMLNYYNRTVDPILVSIVDEIYRKWLTKTARTKGQSIMYFRDPFKLVPVNNLADIADKFSRNEILSSNEIRGIIGFKPAKDPSADELRNKNLNVPDQEKEIKEEIKIEEVSKKKGVKDDEED